jgi:hypothetical protein
MALTILLEKALLGVIIVSKAVWTKGNITRQKRRKTSATKGKGSSERQSLRKSGAYVEKPSHVRVRVLES